MSSDRPEPRNVEHEPKPPEPPQQTEEPEPPEVPEPPEPPEPVLEDEESPALEPPPPPDRGPRPEPGEQWIEEYEAERREKKPRRRIPHLWSTVAVVFVILILVVWTLLSPKVLPEVGEAYLSSNRYANLGSHRGTLDIYWLFDSVHVADTVWGVSISGSPNASADEPMFFEVLVTKVSEDMKNAWFVGTSIKLNEAVMFIEDGDEVGSAVSRTAERFGLVGVIEATFDSPGNYTCYVFVEITIYGKMIVGYLPVKVFRMNAYLDVEIQVE